jgi:hypothetical protein
MGEHFVQRELSAYAFGLRYFSDQCEETRLDDVTNLSDMALFFVTRFSIMRGLIRTQLCRCSRTECYVYTSWRLHSDNIQWYLLGQTAASKCKDVPSFQGQGTDILKEGTTTLLRLISWDSDRSHHHQPSHSLPEQYTVSWCFPSRCVVKYHNKLYNNIRLTQLI